MDALLIPAHAASSGVGGGGWTQDNGEERRRYQEIAENRGAEGKSNKTDEIGAMQRGVEKASKYRKMMAETIQAALHHLCAASFVRTSWITRSL